jgi:hypothetical protein
MSSAPLTCTRRTIYDKFREDHEQVVDPTSDFMQGIPRHPHAKRHHMTDEEMGFAKKDEKGTAADADAGATREASPQQRRAPKASEGPSRAELSADDAELDDMMRAGVSREVAHTGIRMQWCFAASMPFLLFFAFIAMFDYLGDPVNQRSNRRKHFGKKEEWDVIMSNADDPAPSHALKWGLDVPRISKI